MVDQTPNNCPVVLAIPAQAFFHLGIREGLQKHQLSFSVKSEEDIRCYIIEGSQDLISFERLTRVFAKGNSKLPNSYTVPLHETSFRFYRVRQIDNSNTESIHTEDTPNASLRTSSLIQ